MPRILAIDYGRKRVGLAVTDTEKIIATKLETVHSKDVFNYLENYFKKEDVDTIVVGYPITLKGKASEALIYVNPFLKKLIKIYTDKKIVTVDERFTSKIAFQSMIDGGLKQKARRNKETVDSVSAVLILQSYLDQIKFNNI